MKSEFPRTSKDEPRADNFKNHIKFTFDRLKCKSRRDPLISLPVRDKQGTMIAWMKPIIQEYRVTDPDLPELLTRWRVENPTISTGKFVATVERTAKWLDDLVVGRDDRLIFMVNSLQGSPLGHIGFSNFTFEEELGEMDSVLRGVKEGYPGLMSLVSSSLIHWGFSELRMKDITLSVYSDNEPAISFYEKLGFVKAWTKPLYKVILKDEEKLEIAPEGYIGPIEKYYLYMKYQGEKPNVKTL